MRNRVIIAATILVVGSWRRFVPQYIKVRGLEAELRQAREGNVSGDLRDLVGLAYVQANQKNYGIAAATSARYFNRVREVSNQTTDANLKKTLEGLINSRDTITAALAKGDAGVMADLGDLFAKARTATGTPGDQ